MLETVNHTSVFALKASLSFRSQTMKFNFMILISETIIRFHSFNQPPKLLKKIIDSKQNMKFHFS